MKRRFLLLLLTLMGMGACGQGEEQDNLSIEFRPLVAEGGELIDFEQVRLLVGPAQSFDLEYANVELLRTDSLLRYRIAAADQGRFTTFMQQQIGHHLVARMFHQTIAVNKLDIPMPTAGLLYLGTRSQAEARASVLAQKIGTFSNSPVQN